MDGRSYPSTNSVYLLPNENANDGEIANTSITPPYFKTEPLDEAQAGPGGPNLPVHSVERILLQECKPTISPALLSAVEQVTLETRQQHQPLPQLNTLVRSIGRSPPDSGMNVQQQTYMPDQQSMISPGRLSAAPSSGSGSVGGTNDDIYNIRPISPLRGRGRPPLSNPAEGCPRQHTCPECSKRFPNNSALAKHRLIHSDERKFVCDICQKAFKRQDHLNGHLNVHKTVKPFPCIVSGCDKSYCDARSLRRHLEHSHNMQNTLVHSSRGTVYIKCEDYEATIPTNRMDFVSQNDSGESAGQDSNDELSGDCSPTDMMDVESRTGVQSAISADLVDFQTVSKPIGCPQCPRMFKNIPALNGHMRLHSRVSEGKSPGNNNVGDSMSNDGPVFYSHQSSASTTPLGHSPNQQLYSSFQPIQQHVDSSNMSSDMMQSQSDIIYDSQGQPVNQHVQYQQHQHPTLHHCYSNGSVHDYAVNHSEMGASLPVHPYVDDQINSVITTTDPLHVNVIEHHIHGHSHPGALDERGHHQMLSSDHHSIPSLIDSRHHRQHHAAHHQQHQTNISSTGVMTEPMNKNFNQALSVIVPPSTGSPYCPLQPEGHDASLFPELDMPSNSGFGYPGHHHAAGETPLDLGPDLSKDVDDEIIRRELELLYENNTSAAPFGGFDVLNDDDDDFLLGNKVFERKRHLTAPSALATPGSMAGNSGGGSNVYQSNQLSKHTSQPPTAKTSRPPSRMRRKSRGKPDNVFMLLSQNSWQQGASSSKRQFQLPVSPVRFRKHLSGNGNYPGAVTHAKHRLSLGSGKSRANRPAPLIIPTPGTLNRFHSQLRSPRLWIETAAAHTPYTPPPMLSPVRKGSGLFWRINLAFTAIGGPKSAPISPKFCKEFFSRVDCLTEANHPGELLLKTISPPIEQPASVSFELQPPPETDTTPHINVGKEYQADIPDYIENRKFVEFCQHKADLMFDPNCIDDRDEEEIDAYEEFASSCAVVGGCQNKEYALHLLQNTGGNIEESVLLLMNTRCTLNAGHPTFGYEFVDSVPWSVEQIRRFQDALIQYDKDFHMISSEMKVKSVKQCVAFYYTWKKICPDQYRHLKWMRRRRELPEALQQPNAYNLRSCYESGPPSDTTPKAMDNSINNQQQVINAPAASCTVIPIPTSANAIHVDQKDVQLHNELETILNIIAAKSDEKTKETKPRSQPVPLPSAVVATPKTKTGSTNRDGVFPCRLCEKVFYKVKSRNAHMKSHSTKN